MPDNVVEPPKVSLDEIAKATGGPNQDTREITPLQRVGYKLALLLFWVIVGSTTAILVVSFWRTTPSTPPAALTAYDPDSLARYERAVALYKEVEDLPRERAISLFQQIVITGFLPTFTAILGYIFGSRETRG